MIFARDGDDYLVVASMGGAPNHPSWYLNLTANPAAEIQVKGDVIPVTAHTASDDEKPRLWQIVNEVWPNYDVYQTAHRPGDPGRRVVALVSNATASTLPWAERAADRSPAVQRSRARQMEQAKAVVDAARRLIAERGDRFTTQELVKEAGIALQTFYRLFAGKDQLLLAVFEDMIGETLRGSSKQRRKLFPIRSLGCGSTCAETVQLVNGDAPGIGAQFSTAQHWRLYQFFPAEMDQATQQFADLLVRQLEVARAEGLLPETNPPRDAWFVTKLVMAVFHHYAFAEAEAGASTAADDLWDFCRRALGGQRRRLTVLEVPDSLDELLTPAWLTAALSSRFPGVRGHRGDPGPGRRAGLDQRPVPHRVRGAGAAGAAVGALRQGVLLARPAERAAPRASPRRASTAMWPTPPGYAPSTACGPTWIRRATGSRSPKTSLPTGESSWTRSSSFSVEQVASSLEEFARLHVYAWERPDRLGAEWLAPRVGLPLAVRGPARDQSELRRAERRGHASRDPRHVATYRRDADDGRARAGTRMDAGAR